MMSTPSEDIGELHVAVGALRDGRADDAIARLEALADRGVVGTGVAFDRGLAYATRARSGHGAPGDLGRAAHAFEEVLRRDPHDQGARSALDEVRREIARREGSVGGRAAEFGAPPMWRAVVVAAPENVWASIAIGTSLAVAIALVARARTLRGGRLAASTVAIVAAALTTIASALTLGARHLRRDVREAVVVAQRATAIRDGGTGEVGASEGATLELPEGARVDVVEERATTTRVRTDHGDGWVPRDTLRRLPPYRP